MKIKYKILLLFTLSALPISAAVKVNDQLNEADLPPELVAELKKQNLWDGNKQSNDDNNVSNKTRTLVTQRMLFTPELKNQSILKSLNITKTSRVYDPFGVVYTGDEIQEDIGTTDNGEDPQNNQTVERKITLQDASKTLIIRGIKPNHKEFMVEGARNLFEGDRITLKFKDDVFRARIESVTSNQITLRDRKTGDTAIIPVNLIPKSLNLNNSGSANTLDSLFQPMAPVEPIQ